MAGKGQPKTGGRAKGVVNKNVTPLKELAQKLGVDPFEILLKFAGEDWVGLGYPERTETKFTPQGLEVVEYIITPQMRVKAASEACQYIHPKRKALETTVDPVLMDLFKSFEEKTDEELLAIINHSKQDKA